LDQIGCLDEGVGLLARLRGCLKSELDHLGPTLVIARNNSLSDGPERCSVKAGSTALAATAAGWTASHNRASRHPERNLLSAAHRLPMAGLPNAIRFQIARIDRP